MYNKNSIKWIRFISNLIFFLMFNLEKEYIFDNLIDTQIDGNQEIKARLNIQGTGQD